MPVVWACRTAPLSATKYIETSMSTTGTNMWAGFDPTRSRVVTLDENRVFNQKKGTDSPSGAVAYYTVSLSSYAESYLIVTSSLGELK